MEREKGKLFAVLGEVFALLTVLMILFLFLQEYFGFIDNVDIVSTLYLVREYMIIVSLILVGFAFVSKTGVVLFIIYMVAAAAVIVFSFFPEVRDSIMRTITG